MCYSVTLTKITFPLYMCTVAYTEYFLQGTRKTCLNDHPINKYMYLYLTLRTINYTFFQVNAMASPAHEKNNLMPFQQEIKQCFSLSGGHR